MPEHARTGDWITVYGTNLLTVSQGGKKLVTTDPCTVLFGGSAEVEGLVKRRGSSRKPVGKRLHAFEGAAAGGADPRR